MINNIAGYALAIVGAIYIGRLGALPLSASVLANSLYNCTGLSLALGLSAGMETLCGQVRTASSMRLWVVGHMTAVQTPAWVRKAAASLGMQCLLCCACL